MSNFKISKLENLFVQELNKQLSQVPPLSINKKLYEFACNRAKEVMTKRIKNIKGGTRERRTNFPTAKRYREICFVSVPISSTNSEGETSKALCSLIINHYSSDFRIGVNSIGPALIPLKSNKILVIIFIAFFQPFVTVSKFNQEFEPLSKQKFLPDDKDHFVDLLNRFRALANFDELNTRPCKSDSLSFCFDRYHYSVTVSYSIQLFQKLMSDCKLYDILIDYWTNFSIETTPDPKDKSRFLLTLKFWRFDSYLLYKVDVLILPPKDRKDGISTRPEDITTRGTDINLEEQTGEQPILDDLANTEVIKNRLNQEIKDLNNQAQRDAEGVIDAQAARNNYARQEAEAYQEAKEARELKAQYEDQAARSAAIAHQAENSLNQANQNALDAQQKLLEAAQRATNCQNDAEVQDAICKESEKVKQEAEKKEKEAEEKEQKALEAANVLETEAQNQVDLAKQFGDSEDVILAVQNQEVVERKVDNLLQIAEDAQKTAQNEEDVINKAETVAQEAIQTKNNLIDEIQKQNQIQEEQQIIQEVEASKIPEYSSIAEQAMQQAEIFQNAAEKEAEIARAAEAAEKDARKKKNAADLVAAALQRSSNFLESKAEVVEVAEEVFDAEASHNFDLELDKLNNNVIESETQVIGDTVYVPYEHDEATDKENLSVYDFIASNENGLVRDDLENFDFNNDEAMAMLKAENVNDFEKDNANVPIIQNDTLIEEEEETVNENPKQPVLYMFEARDSEVEPVFDPESAKETELAHNDEVPFNVESEAAKELEESA